MTLLNMLAGYKTYLSAIGLVGLGIYQLSTGDIPTGIQSILGAAAAASLKNAIATTAVVVAPTPARPVPIAIPPTST